MPDPAPDPRTRYWIHTMPRTVAVAITRHRSGWRARCNPCGWSRATVTDTAAAAHAAHHLRSTHA